ncbi:MAG: hypothetical protein ACMZ64_01165 [Oleiphilus sp.]
MKQTSKTGTIQNQPAHEENAANAGKLKGFRLPCRGCIATCKNYQRCDGKPWRLTE